MENIFALSIQLKRSISPDLSYTLDEATAQALLAKLSSTYTESLIWYTTTRIAVWVVGDDPDFVLKSFAGLKKFTAYMKLLSGQQANKFFAEISNGRKWRNYSSLKKYEQLCKAESMSAKTSNLGERLKGLIRSAQ